MRSGRAYLPAAVLIVGCLLLWRAHAQATMPPAAPLTSVMPEVSGYTTVEQTFGEQERRVAGMTDYVARAYRRDTAVVFTTLVSYYDRQVQGVTIHSPRNCLPGSGWEILKPGRRQIVVDGSPHMVNGYLLKNGANVALTYYWYQGRGRVAADEYVVKWNLLRDAAILGRTEEALVRVIVPVEMTNANSVEESYRHAYGIADQVAATLIREVNRIMPSLAFDGRHEAKSAARRGDAPGA
jgi:EpsI family protein